MQDATAAVLADKAAEPITVFLPQLIEALASLNVQVVSLHNQLKTEETQTDNKITPNEDKEAQLVLAEQSPFIRPRPAPIAPIAISPIMPGTIATVEMTPSVVKIGALEKETLPSADTKDPAEGVTDDDKPTGFVCSHCGQHNLLRSSRETVYLVTVGRAVGVFTGWHNVQPLVSGVPHACYKKYSSKATAVEAFEEALIAGTVIVV